MTTYRIERCFARDDLPREVIVRGLTLEQAQAHCSDPETSSKTCTTVAGQDRTRRLGPWFDAYYPEADHA